MFIENSLFESKNIYFTFSIKYMMARKHILIPLSKRDSVNYKIFYAKDILFSIFNFQFLFKFPSMFIETLNVNSRIDSSKAIVYGYDSTQFFSSHLLVRLLSYFHNVYLEIWTKHVSLNKDFLNTSIKTFSFADVTEERRTQGISLIRA